MTDELDLADVQGTILRGYRVDFARHFVLEVVDAGAARGFLGSLVDGSPGVPQITTAARWTDKPQSFLNAGITAEGLVALGQSVGGFPASFTLGATSPVTAQTVGDTGPSAPQNWTDGLAQGDAVHVLLSLWAHEDESVLEQVSEVLRTAFAGAMDELGAIDAAALPQSRVHFGYADGISQPTVAGAPPRKRPLPDCQPVAPTGEFLMGYPSQNNGSVYSVEPSELSTNSSFAAFRVLEQDVSGFESWLQAGAQQAGIDGEMLAAKVCGRWRSGVPLVLSPQSGAPDPPIAPDQINNYDYVSSDPAVDDTFGYRCPIGAHMRRANPRGEHVLAGGQHNHRIVRRAMPYGPEYDPEHPVDAHRGLVGYFINADIQNQFEFLMGQWINQSDFVMSVWGPGGANPANSISGADVMLGDNDPASSSFIIPVQDTTSPPPLTGFERFISTRGGAYCYLPSISALRYICAAT